MCAYNATAYIPKYVHFHQVTLSYMRKRVISQTDHKHEASGDPSKALQLRYAIRDHEACTEIEGLVAWKQEAEGLS